MQHRIVRKGVCDMSQDVNMIVLCDHKDCPYCHRGECGKDVLYWNDDECEAQGEKTNDG